MAYAHAVNLARESQPDLPPNWLIILCNADAMKRWPHFSETFDLENLYVNPDGTVVEMLEEKS